MHARRSGRLSQAFLELDQNVPAQSERALALVTELRRAGLRAELDLGGRAMKGQMKQADRAGAAVTVILGEDGGAQVRDMQTGEQRELDITNAVEELSR